MSIIIVLPERLASEKYLTLATWGLVAATFILGVATLLLFLDGRTKSKEQRQRWVKEDADRQREHAELLEKWHRDDQSRIESEKPHYRWGFNHDLDRRKIGVWIANLGTTSLLLTTVWVERQDPLDRHPIDPRPVPFVLTEVIDKGTRMNFDVFREFSFPSRLPMGQGGLTTVRYEVWCTIESTESHQTSRKAIAVTLNRSNVVVATSEDATQKPNPSLAVI